MIEEPSGDRPSPDGERENVGVRELRSAEPRLSPSDERGRPLNEGVEEPLGLLRTAELGRSEDRRPSEDRIEGDRLRELSREPLNDLEESPLNERDDGPRAASPPLNERLLNEREEPLSPRLNDRGGLLLPRLNDCDERPLSPRLKEREEPLPLNERDEPPPLNERDEPPESPRPLRPSPRCASAGPATISELSTPTINAR